MREAIGGDATAIKSHQERNQEHSGAQSRALRSAIKSHQERNQEPSGAQSRALRWSLSTHLSSGTGFIVLIAGSVAVYSPPAEALTSFSLT